MATLALLATTVTPASAAAVADGSMPTVARQIGADELWAKGITGSGVNIAVIDTGVAPVPALLGPTKVVAMVDLSFEAHVPEAVYLDTNGHGTHITGIIAGNDPATGFRGIAPGAGIISVKVGDNTGAVDVSQVIAGIDWVVQHRELLNIKVINLSYGTDGTQDPAIDPLAAAVERAWHAGIVVVVAAGNDRDGLKQLTNPASDPFVIAVGAATVVGDGQDMKSRFTAKAKGDRLPDVVAPGVSIESLRVPGSRVAVEHPEGYVDELTMKGSGTSQAAAVVSGAVALLLEARPHLTPDQVKALLRSTAATARGDHLRVGEGLVDVLAAVSAATPGDEAIQRWPRSTGSGSLEAARGSDHVVVDGEEIRGEQTVQGASWVGASWTGASWTGASWTGASWTGASWVGASWTGASWTGASWVGASWTGASWTGASWTGASWVGASWTGASWVGASWTGASWTGASWVGASWTGASWVGVGFHAATWG